MSPKTLRELHAAASDGDRYRALFADNLEEILQRLHGDAASIGVYRDGSFLLERAWECDIIDLVRRLGET